MLYTFPEFILSSLLKHTEISKCVYSVLKIRSNKIHHLDSFFRILFGILLPTKKIVCISKQ